MTKWNGKRFSIYTSEEETVLGLLNELGTLTNNVSDSLDNKTDLHGDHKGTWQGLNKPTLAEEGLRATVEDLIDNKLPLIQKNIDIIKDNKADVSYVENNINSLNNTIEPILGTLETKANKTELEVERERINLLTKVNNGSTEGNTELLDIRVSNSGKQYTTAGVSIREQFKEINTVLGKEYFTPSFISGYYIRAVDGNRVVNEAYGTTNAISLCKGEELTVECSGATNNVSIISLSDSLGNALSPLVVSNSNNVKEYKYKTNVDVNVIISAKTGSFVKAYISKYNVKADLHQESISGIVKVEPITHSITKGFFFNPNGVKAENAGYFITSSISLKENEYIQFYVRGSGTNVSLLTEVDNNGKYVRTIIRSVDNTPKQFLYKATKDINVIISCALDVNYYINKIIPTELLQNVNEKDTFNFTPLFDKCVCIGDSITEGSIGHYPVGEKIRSFSYPKALKKLTGWEVTNLGKSGSNPTTWWNSYKNHDFSNYEVAFIMFGRNKSFESETDIPNYNNLITKLKTDNPNITIFILSLAPAINNNEVPINETIKEIANSNKLPYLDIFTDNEMTYDKSDLYRPGDGVHYNKIGYTMLAQYVIRAFNEYVYKNLEEFKYLYIPPKE